MANFHFVCDGYHLQKAFFRAFKRPPDNDDVLSIGDWLRNAILDRKSNSGLSSHRLLGIFVTGGLAPGINPFRLRRFVTTFDAAIQQTRTDTTQMQFTKVPLVRKILTDGKPSWGQDEAKCDGALIVYMNQIPKDDILLLMTADGKLILPSSQGQTKNLEGIITAFKAAKKRGVQVKLATCAGGTPNLNLIYTVGPKYALQCSLENLNGVECVEITRNGQKRAAGTLLENLSKPLIERAA